MVSRVWLVCLLTLAATFTFGPSSLRAEEPKRASAPYLVVVGVGTFDDQSIDPRPTADVDAQAFYDHFTDPKYLGVPADRARLLLSKAQGKAEKATHDSIIAAIDDAASKTQKDDTVIIAFFGRGASANDKTCFFTPDTVLKDRAKTGLLFGTDLEAPFKKLENQNVILFLDITYKGFKPAKGVKIAEPNLTDLDHIFFGPEDKQDSTRPPDRMMLLSGFVSSDPITKGNNGLFASTVLDALRGAADAAPYMDGYGPDGVVTTDELVKFMEKEYSNQARTLGKTDKEKETMAIPIGASTSHFILSRNPAEFPRFQKLIAAIQALGKSGALSAELTNEGVMLLSRMPKLKAYQELRKNYEKLAGDSSSYTVAMLTADRAALREAMKLDPKEAEVYARRVLDVQERMIDYYIRELNAGELTAAAIKGMYRRVEKPLPPELIEALKNPKSLNQEQRMAILEKARMYLGNREDLEGTKDVDLSLQMMLASLNDPYTIYFDADAVRRMASALRGRFPGVGIQIRRDAVHDALLVVTPIMGSPAYEAGIQAGDLIVGIKRDVDSQGRPLTDDAPREYTTKGMKTEDAIKVITGVPGSEVTLVIQRGDEPKTRDFKLKRRLVLVESVLGTKRKANGEWSYWLDDDAKIGYVHLTQFIHTPDGRGTYADLKKAVLELKAGGMKGLVLDLRGNPGGFLISAVRICELFVGREKIVSVKPRPGSGAGAIRVYNGTARGETGFSLVVLINGNSASASEIVSACLQDHERAIVVGERSYGKGSVQDILPINATGGEVKLTIARYYPPSDRNIDKVAATNDPKIKDWGVTPNKGFEVKLTREEQTDLAQHLRDLEIIQPPNAKPKKESKPFVDKQLERAVKYLKM